MSSSDARVKTKTHDTEETAATSIPTTEKRTMLAAYNPGSKLMRCCISRAQNAVRICRIIPTHPAVQDPMRNQMIELGLVPKGTTEYSHLNLLPLDAGHHISFDTHLWTLYPQKDVLASCIAIEEASMLHRETCVANGHPDPGRKTYDAAYGTFPKESLFDIHFSTIYSGGVFVQYNPFVPYDIRDGVPYLMGSPSPEKKMQPINLIASVNIIVEMRTGVMMGCPGTAEAMEKTNMGMYLIHLWHAGPNDFRTLMRPNRLLPPLPEPAAEAQEPSSSAPTAGSASTATSLTNPQQPPVPQYHTRSEAGDSTENPTPVQLIGMRELIESMPKEKGDYGSFTSNEWALAVYGVDLMGNLDIPRSETL